MDHRELDVLADQPAQQMRQLDQDVGHVEHARLQGLLAREGEQLAHQVGGAVGVLFDLHDIGEGLVARPVAQQQQVREPDQRSQQVVEVVSDPTSQLAHGLRLLGLGELNLQVAPLGRVDEMRDVAGRAAGQVGHGLDVHRRERLATVPEANLQRRLPLFFTASA